MSYETLIKETDALTYEEQINLMAYLATSIQAGIKKSKDEVIQQKIKAIDTLSGLFTKEEMIPVDESIATGLKMQEIDL